MVVVCIFGTEIGRARYRDDLSGYRANGGREYQLYPLRLGRVVNGRTATALKT